MSKPAMIAGGVAVAVVLALLFSPSDAKASAPPKDEPPPPPDVPPGPGDGTVIVGPPPVIGPGPETPPVIIGPGQGDACLNGRTKILADGTCPAGFERGEALVEQGPGDCGCVPIALPAPPITRAVIAPGERVLFVVDSKVGNRAALVKALLDLAASTGNTGRDLPMLATGGIDRQTFANNAMAQGMLSQIDTVVTLVPNPTATDWGKKKVVEILDNGAVDPGYDGLRSTGSTILGIRLPPFISNAQFNAALKATWAQLTNPSGTTQAI